MRKYVITAGPGNGKTTIIELLASRGYSIMPEAARLIIDEEKLKNSDILPWKDLEKFQEKVAQKQIELEASAKGDEIFLDRGLIDGHGYCKNANVPTPDVVLNNSRDRYTVVFLLDQLSLYAKDSARFEDDESARKIHDAIADAYIEFGYQTISVPAFPPDQRVDFILNYISNNP